MIWPKPGSIHNHRSRRYNQLVDTLIRHDFAGRTFNRDKEAGTTTRSVGASHRDKEAGATTQSVGASWSVGASRSLPKTSVLTFCHRVRINLAVYSHSIVAGGLLETS